MDVKLKVVLDFAGVFFKPQMNTGETQMGEKPWDSQTNTDPPLLGFRLRLASARQDGAAGEDDFAWPLPWASPWQVISLEQFFNAQKFSKNSHLR